MTFIDEHSLAELRDLAEMTVTLAAAAEAGVFLALARRAATADEVATRVKANQRATRILLLALEDLGLLVREGESFRLADRAVRELGDPASPDFQARGLPLWLENLRAWTRLPEVLATGTPLSRGGEAPSEEALARYMAGMAATPAERVVRVVDACLEGAPSARTVLDLGGGPGLYSREFVERGLEATLVDRPEVVEHVARVYGLSDVPRLRLVGEDFLAGPLPEGPFDVVLMGNVIHIYGPEDNRELVRKVAGVSRPGGVLGIADFIRGASSRAARFALVMLLQTEEGDTYSMEEIGEWLEDAGFRDPELREVDADRHLVRSVRS